MDNDVIIAQHKKDKQESVAFKERRFNQWNENYLLYRDKVATNRLVQRQPVNVPIIRETIQSWISKIDEAPDLKFETRGRGNKDKSGEIIMNELWGYYYDKLKLELVDNLDKKIVGLQGRSFKKWGWANNEVFCDIIDPYDIEMTTATNTLDLNTADNIIQTHIFRSLKKILANPKYSQTGKDQLKIYLQTSQGILRANDDMQSYQSKVERLVALGVTNYDQFMASDVVVELNESYRMIWNDEKKKFVRHLIVIAMDNIVLYNKPLKEAIGIDFLPFVSWAADPDLNDMWSDGIADSVRTFNKITNMYISQDLENRTYRNFGMYFFNTMNGTFQPRAFEPKPFGMYGVPGDPNQIVKQMEINPLPDTSRQIDWLKALIQSSVAQTPVELGQVDGEATLGATQLSFQQSRGRNQIVSKNYRRAWKESGLIFYELIKENSRGSIRLYKKGGDNNYYAKDVFPSDWKNPEGYECKVVTKTESDVASDFDLKKIQYIKNSFAGNNVAMNIAKRKELELVGWSPEEIEAVMQSEEQAQANAKPQEKISQSINFKDLPPEGQKQMAALAGIDLVGGSMQQPDGVDNRVEGASAPSMVNNPNDSIKDINSMDMSSML